MQNNYQQSINTALKELFETKNISSAISVGNTLLEYIGLPIKSVEDVELSKLKLPNAERYDRWFDAHPHFRGDRACFELTSKDSPIEAKFYALKKRSKLFIAGSVNFTPNFEDRDYTRNDPSMRIGIDFFLTPEKDSVIVVLSNKGNLRLVELSKKLTNTQVDIFALWHDIAKVEDKNTLHTTIWESFKLSSLNKDFYKGISNSFTSLTQHLRDSGVEEQLANQFSNRLLGRLLFIWFLRKKNIINEAKEYFVLDGMDDTGYYKEKLEYLFFNVLNTDIPDRENVQKGKGTLFGVEKEAPSLFVVDSLTPYLNGGLFDPKADGEYWEEHSPTFPTGFFKNLYEHFDSFNFTTDESTPEYEQIAIDPEMLGRIFESFLATLTTETGAQAKKANGAFYTPREIVGYMSRESLRQYLYTALDAGVTLKSSIDDLLDIPDSDWALSGSNSKRDAVAKEDRERIMDALRNIRVLDPAVGSGAFPMGILHKILSLFERLDPNFDAYETKLSILRNNIYGVDIDPTAIEISRLRAWLSIIVDVKDVKKIKPLPNLEFKFVCANSLIGLDTTIQQSLLPADPNLKSELMRIRDEYYATSNKKTKEKLQKEYGKLTHPQQAGIFDTEETRQLKSYRPFENGRMSSFYDPDLMHGVSAFDVVIGNPPYVQLQKFARTQIQKDLEKQNFKTFTKNADLYCLFYEQALELLKNKGALVFITSNKWMRSGYGEKLREYFVNEANPKILIDFGGFKVFESATVDTNILIVEKDKNTNSLQGVHFKNDYKKGDSIPEYINTHSITLSHMNKDSWFVGSTAEVDLKTKIEALGKPLKDWDVKIYRGVLTGLNEAFIVDQKKRSELISQDAKSAEIIKPILRGRDIKRYGYEFANLYVLMTGFDIDIPAKYPAVYEHLKKFEEKAKKRDDQGKNWYNLRSCAYYEEFGKEKVMYPVMSSSASFFYDKEGFYCNDKGFFISGTNLKYLTAVLNSGITHYYLKQIGSPLGDAAIEYRKIYLDLFPVPPVVTGNKTSVDTIENLVDQILFVKKVDPKADTKALESQIDTLVYQLYALTPEEIKIIESQK